MNNSWSDFIQARPIRSDLLEADCALTDLSHFGLIQVEGEDAMTFLQGQLTNDMREVNASHSNLAGWCTAKGRMLYSFRVMRRDSAYLLQLPMAFVEAALKRLRMYVMRSKVQIEDASSRWARCGITGDCAVEVLQKHLGNLPDKANGAVRHGETLLIRMPGDIPRFELIGPSAELGKIWLELEANAAHLGPDFWALQEIRAGIPTVLPETAEAFVPQMTNMQLIDGVSFTKGCYTGQEVVARMQYLGKLKRRMYLAHVGPDAAPKPGDELVAAGSTSGQGAGKVVDARRSADGYDLLAVIEVASAEVDEVRLGENGPILELRELPYAFATETE